MRRQKYTPLFAFLLIALTLLLVAPGVTAQQAGRRAAATENELASRAAIAVMQAGGNAVDGAVAAAFMAGVVSPQSSGIGGGGFALVWLAEAQRSYLLDFRETAPQGVDAAAFERRPLGDAERGKYVGVPGEVAGLFELHRAHGKRPWKDVVEPARSAAKLGFPLGKFLASSLASQEKRLKVDATLASVFFPGGKPAVAGARVQRPLLGATLERIAAEGPKALYEGPIAQDIVDTARAAGGALTLEELRSYRPIERKPIEVSWEGYRVLTMPLPSAGGMMVAQTLRLFSKQELAKLGRESGAYQHLIAEAMRGSLADRMRHLGDGDHQKVDMDALVAEGRMAQRRKTIAIDRTHALPRFGLEGQGTHHLVTMDEAGNMVSLTTTVNRSFGAKLVTKGGIVLNDELDDFTAQKDVAPFALAQSPNRPRPGARPLSSMTPTIVLRDGKAVLGLGGSGGPTIATNVTQLLLDNLVFGLSPAEAVKARRFYVPSSRATILLEDGASEALKKDLAWRGEIVATMPFKSSAVQMIAVHQGRVLAASDPRKLGGAIVK